MAFIQRVIHALLTQPPHPIFVHFPIALCTVAFFFILLALWRKNDFFEQIAFALICLAPISAVVAGIIGYRDNLVFYQGHAANYIIKIILASIVFVITAVTAISRWRNPKLFHDKGRAIYIGSYFVSFVLVFVLGFLGGVIIYGF